MNEFKVKLTLGDWSEDGHERHDNYNYISNYPVNIIRQAYKDSCRKTGLTFNDREDYTGLGLPYESPRKVWVEDMDCEISEEAYNILMSHGIDAAEYYEDDEMNVIETVDAARLVMDFIGLSMPKDWSYKLVEDDFEPINGCSNGEFDGRIGYGLYEYC